MSAQGFGFGEMTKRLNAIRQWMSDHGWDGLLVSNPANVRYLAGFRGEPATLWIDHEQALLITHIRSQRWAEEQTETFTVLCNPDPLAEVKAFLTGRTLRIGVDAQVTHTKLNFLRQSLSGHELDPVSGIESLRRIKSEPEITVLRESQQINERIFDGILGQIRSGMSERAVQGLILTAMAEDESVEGPSFTPIVAAAGNAWEIHHQPDSTPLRSGDMVIIDLGVRHRGYCSDMTRTICLGKASGRMRGIHATVREAQLAAFASLTEGASAHAVDGAARNVITAAGHGDTFSHGLGHGIGLETHDAGVRLTPGGEDFALRSGMALTIEPGIYLENQFGVRTEDVIIVREDGFENLTTTTHELIELPT